MITFYPGPSQVYPQIATFLQDAFHEKVLSTHHRSPLFEEICRNAVERLKEKQNIPQDYSVFFASSATECWEMIAQSLPKTPQYHLYNGSFGEKWFHYNNKIKKNCKGLLFNKEENIPLSTFNDGTMICLTQNETSNGTQVSLDDIAYLRKINTDHLIAIDVTSSMGGIEFNWNDGDIWFTSVQKCLGLPAGLGLMVCSPRAIAAVKEQDPDHFYNSMIFSYRHMQKHQTPYTPNVLTLYLLSRIMEVIPNIKLINKATQERAQKLYENLDQEAFSFYIKNKKVRSSTVLVFEGSEEQIIAMHRKASQKGIILGKGYGPLAQTTFRAANFPAITDEDFSHFKRLFDE